MANGSLNQELEEELAQIGRDGLRRGLRRIGSAQAPHLISNGESLLSFCSNDYLGLANEPALREAACQAIARYGVGSGASRLICGSLSPHHELEEAMAEFKGAEATLSFSTGYAAALGTICALLSKEDTVVLDKLVHASIVDAARLCGAEIRVFPHNQLDRLEEILRWADQRRGRAAPGRNPRVLVVTESVFSMDGDLAPLREITALKEKYGAWLMVDEAHATGLYGPKRSGLIQALGLSANVEIQLATLGKALGSSGGVICGSRALVDLLVNRARSFIFSTAPMPAAAASATASIRFVQSAEGEVRCRSLWERVADVEAVLGRPPSSFSSAIVPVMVGDEIKALQAAERLRESGLLLPAIRYPTVARGRARLRLTLSATHTPTDIQQLATALRSVDLLPQTVFNPA
jgi:8-amino-7-oxononanoate synthase